MANGTRITESTAPHQTDGEKGDPKPTTGPTVQPKGPPPHSATQRYPKAPLIEGGKPFKNLK